jgi:hypothetical protein
MLHFRAMMRHLHKKCKSLGNNNTHTNTHARICMCMVKVHGVSQLFQSFISNFLIYKTIINARATSACMYLICEHVVTDNIVVFANNTHQFKRAYLTFSSVHYDIWF